MGSPGGVQTWRLNDVCDFHYLQPGSTVTIGDDNFTYRVVDYDKDERTITVSGPETISALSFTLRVPFFCHGTPLQTEAENAKVSVNVKTPMVYVMEPYQPDYNYDENSSIDSLTDLKICFLTQAEVNKWVTDDFYHNAINPMKNLMEDFIQMIIDSNLFHTAKMRASPMFHTKFGINIRDLGTKKLWFSENLSGVSVDLRLEMYKADECECTEVATFQCPDDSVLGENLIPEAYANQNIYETSSLGVQYALGGGWQRGVLDDGTVRFTHDDADDDRHLVIDLPEPSPLNTAYFLTMKVHTYPGMELEDIGLVVNFDGSDYFPVVRESFENPYYSRTFLRDPESPPAGLVKFTITTIGPDATAGWRGYLEDIQIRTLPTNFVA
jgi:hypothetical protein